MENPKETYAELDEKEQALFRRMNENLIEYYEAYRQPITVTRLLRPHAPSLSRAKLTWMDVERILADVFGVTKVLSPKNKKYFFPEQAGDDISALRDLVYEMEEGRL